MNSVGRLTMSVAIALYTVIPPLVDLITDTHVFNIQWVPHARMHTVWLLGTTSGVGLIALYLLWSADAHDRFRINLSGILSVVVLGAFFLSAVTISLYGGSLSDMADDLYKGPFGVDANLFLFTIAAILLAVGWHLCVCNKK
ncbi:MAG: hypothetical protein P8J79_06050 [Halioglobus sp.]|nr:hypothetical protein [Halioglobus sp.]